MTTNIMMGSIQDALEGFGFSGGVLKDMCVLVKSKSDLEDLEAFVINNDEKLTTNLSILYAYKKHKMAQDQMNMFDFMFEYKYAISIVEKQKCLETLLKGNIELRWVEDLERRLDSGDTTLGDFYKAFTDNPNLHVRKLVIEAVSLTQGIDW